MSDGPIDINKARKKKAQKQGKSGKEPKINPVKILYELAYAVDRDPLSPLHKNFPFPIDFQVIEPDLGNKFILKCDESQNVMTVSDNYAKDQLLDYTSTKLLDYNSTYQIRPAFAKETIELWKSLKKPINPSMILWADEPGWTYRRLPWAKNTTGPTPYWDKLVGRMGPQGLAFMAFVGSIFEPQSDVQQYLYLYGAGQDGKGAIIRFLSKVLGQAAVCENVPTQDKSGGYDKFWTKGLLHKRLVCFPDSNASGFMASGLFKQLTGGDPVRIELKFGDSFTAQLNCKYIFSSNRKPRLSSEKADLRRPIFVHMEPNPDKHNTAYETHLMEEGGAFITACLHAYALSCPGHGRIPVDEEVLTTHVAQLEEDLEVFAHESFLFPEFDDTQPQKDWPQTLPAKMQEILRNRWASADDPRREKFLAYLERQYGVKYNRIRVSKDDRYYAYLGCVPRSQLVP